MDFSKKYGKIFLFFQKIINFFIKHSLIYFIFVQIFLFSLIVPYKTGDTNYYNLWTFGIFHPEVHSKIFTDISFVYLPLAIVPMIIPALCVKLLYHGPLDSNLLADAFRTRYYYNFAYFALILTCSILIYVIIRKYGLYKKESQFIFTTTMLFTGQLWITRLEPFLVLIILFGIYLFLARKLTVLPTFVLSMGGMLKLVPFFTIIPIFSVSKKKIRIILTSIITSVASIVPFFLFHIKLKNLFSFLTIESNRGLETGSFFSWPFVFYRNYISPTANITVFDRTLNFSKLVDSNITIFIEKYVNVLQLALLFIAFVCFLFMYNKAKKYSQKTVAELFLLELQIIIVVLIIINKTGSPQYIFWLTPVFIYAASNYGFQNRFWNKNTSIYLILVFQRGFPSNFIPSYSYPLKQTIGYFIYIYFLTISVKRCFRIYTNIKYYHFNKQQLAK